MVDAIQLAALVTFSVAVVYLASLAYREWRLSGMVSARHDIERERSRAEVHEILERTRVRAEKSAGAWSGFRKFRVSRKVDEAAGVGSFYLEPHDGRPLPPFEPGQFLNFKLQVDEKSKPLFPCYSLSECSNSDFYRVTIKRLAPPADAADAPPGLSSSYFNDVVDVGTILDVKAPRGQFYLDTTRHTPVVLIGGGIGITPVLSMLNHIVHTGSHRETWFFLGVRDGSDHIMKSHLQEIADSQPNLHLIVIYSNPREGSDAKGRDYDEKGRVNVDLFKRFLPSNNYDFYFCGPPPMMDTLFEGLRSWAVPEDRIHYEAFGPATVGKKKEADTKRDTPDDKEQKIDVTFSHSNKTIAWDSSSQSLLRFALDNGVAIDHSCEAGNCGTCMIALISGEVDYISEPAEPAQAGTCYSCISVPKGPVVIDA